MGEEEKGETFTSYWSKGAFYPKTYDHKIFEWLGEG